MDVHINNITHIPLLSIRELRSGIFNRNILDLSSKNEVKEIYGLREGLDEGKVYEGMLKAVDYH